MRSTKIKAQNIAQKNCHEAQVREIYLSHNIYSHVYYPVNVYFPYFMAFYWSNMLGFDFHTTQV